MRIGAQIDPGVPWCPAVAPDAKEHKWPEALRVGGGAYAMLLLKDVPIWYELWRNVNGFPPDYYKAPVKKSTVKAKSNEK